MAAAPARLEPRGMYIIKPVKASVHGSLFQGGFSERKLFEGFFFNVNCFKGYERVKLWARLL
jgi:hypothetical protein